MMGLINFEDAIEANRKLMIAPDTEDEVVGYFSKIRVDWKTVPEGWYIYEIRSNGYGYFKYLEPKHITVNYAGTFLSKKPLNLKNREYYRLKSEYDYMFL